MGGKARVEMARLKVLFESLGCTHVITYINSGNVIFEDTRSEKALTQIIEQAIKTEFGFAVPVVLRTYQALSSICASIPTEWKNDTEQKTDVMFLWSNIDNKVILQKVSVNPTIEQVLYIPGALVWNIGRQNVARGGGIKLIKSDLYSNMTVRNINTTRTLLELMETSKHNK